MISLITAHLDLLEPLKGSNVKRNRHPWLSGSIIIALCLTGTWGTSGVVINQVAVDEKPVTRPAALQQPGHATQPLRITSSHRSLQFHFVEEVASNEPPARLRYRLEGCDTAWCDLPVEPAIRVCVQFWDLDNRIVGTTTFDLSGETPGWRGSIEKSDFVTRRETVTAPDRTKYTRIIFISQGENDAIGMAAMDPIRLLVEHPGTNAEPEEIDWSLSRGTDLDNPYGAPANWVREGARADMAVLAVRPTPIPHPVLVLNDVDSIRYALWGTIRKPMIPARPGDRFILEWATAHSVGRCGPGTAGYPRLPPGRYTFRVAAAKSSGELTATETALQLEIVKPWHQRAENWALLALATAAVAAWFNQRIAQARMRRRIAELEREQALEKERDRIARDLHDDIGAGLTEIAMQSAWIRRDLERGATSDALPRLERVCHSADELARSIDEIVWAVNPANDTLDRFANYLVQAASQLLDATGIRVRYDIPLDLPNAIVEGKVRHFLLLATREALNNSVKHARPELIRIAVAATADTLRITVEDNGRGFDPAQAGNDGLHEGLENMRRRMRELGGQFLLESAPGRGTRIELAATIKHGESNDKSCRS